MFCDYGTLISCMEIPKKNDFSPCGKNSQLRKSVIKINALRQCDLTDFTHTFPAQLTARLFATIQKNFKWVLCKIVWTTKLNSLRYFVIVRLSPAIKFLLKIALIFYVLNVLGIFSINMTYLHLGRWSKNKHTWFCIKLDKVLWSTKNKLKYIC